MERAAAGACESRAGRPAGFATGEPGAKDAPPPPLRGRFPGCARRLYATHLDGVQSLPLLLVLDGASRLSRGKDADRRQQEEKIEEGAGSVAPLREGDARICP